MKNGLILILAIHAAAWAGFAQSAPSRTVEALELYRHGECKKALPLFEQILTGQPRNMDIRRLYARCLTREGREDMARAQYKAILAASPNDPDALQALAPSSKAALPKAAPVAPPALAPAVPAAAPTVKTVSASVRVTPPADLYEAEKMIKGHQLEKAEELLTRLKNEGKANDTVLLRLAEIYSGSKRFTLAATTYAELASNNPQSEYLTRAAQNYAWGKEYGQAAKLYRQRLERVHGDADAQLGLANVLMWDARFDNAGDEFRNYLALKPQDTDARKNFASVLLWGGRYADSIEQLAMVKAARAGDATVDATIAQAYERMGKLDYALRAYDQAIKQNPSDVVVRSARAQLDAELPRRKAFESIETNDNQTAAQFFLAYLKDHPESDETLLQVARSYNWGKQPKEASAYYRQYLQRKPGDVAALRELGKCDLSVPDYAAASADYQELIKAGAAGKDDYEQLIHAYTWGKKLEAAQPAAQKLAALDPGNAVALEAMDGYLQQQKSEFTSRAQTLAAAKRFDEAVDVYREYQNKFGTDAVSDLAVARLYSWATRYGNAETAYYNYLLKNPDDTQARLELAMVETWNKRYTDASNDYRKVLASQPNNSEALVGLAKISDYSGEDPFRVIDSYRKALRANPENAVVAERVRELVPSVSPSLGYGFKSFGDSDGLYRAVNTFEASFPFVGRLQLTPYYDIDYFHQFRQVGGASCGATSTDYGPTAAALSGDICDHNGTFWGKGGGLKARVGSLAGTYFEAQAGAMQFGGAPTVFTGRATLMVDLGGRSRLGFQASRAPAIFDLNTVGSLAAGVVSDTVLGTYETAIGQRWRLATQAGVTHYSNGMSGLSTNMQRRFSSRLTYQVTSSLNAGYFVRYSSFQRESPLYFSPQRYMTYGFAYGWNHQIAKGVKLALDSEAGLGRIRRFGTAQVNTFEMAAQPMIIWEVAPGLEFRVGYRFSRGQTSAFGSPAYTTGGAEFGLTKSLGIIPGTPNSSRLELH